MSHTNVIRTSLINQRRFSSNREWSDNAFDYSDKPLSYFIQLGCRNFKEPTVKIIINSSTGSQDAYDTGRGAESLDNNDYLGSSKRRNPLANTDTQREQQLTQLIAHELGLNSYLTNIYALEEKSKQRAASKIIFQFIELNFSLSNLSAINTLLKTIDLARLSVYSIAGLVRFTSRARRHLPYWTTLFINAKQVLKAREQKEGYKTEDVLIGIKG